PESGHEFLDSLPRSLGALFSEPAATSVAIRGQEFCPPLRRRLDDDVRRRLCPLARPAFTVEADRVGAVFSEAERPCRRARRARAAALEVSHDAVDDATGVNRLAGARPSERMVDAPDKQRIDHGLERLPLGRESIPHLALPRLLPLHDTLVLESREAGAEPFRRDGPQGAFEFAGSPRDRQLDPVDGAGPPLAH